MTNEVQSDEVPQLKAEDLNEIPPRLLVAIVVRAIRRVYPLVPVSNSKLINTSYSALLKGESFYLGRETRPKGFYVMARHISEFLQTYSNADSGHYILYGISSLAGGIGDVLSRSEDFPSYGTLPEQAEETFSSLADALKSTDAFSLPIKQSSLLSFRKAVLTDIHRVVQKLDDYKLDSDPLGKKVDLEHENPFGPLWYNQEPDWFEKKQQVLNETLNDLIQDDDYFNFDNPEDTFFNEIPEETPHQNDKSKLLEARVSLLESLIEDLDPKELTRESKERIEQLVAETQKQVTGMSELLLDTSKKAQSFSVKCKESEATINKLTQKITVIEEQAKQSNAKVEEFLETAQETLKQKVLVEGPIKFWKEKATNHNIWFALYSIVTLTVGTTGVSTLFRYWKALFGEGDVKSWQIGSILFAATVLLLLLRVLTRITLSNLHLATEAAERSVMMETYLGLMSQDKLQDEQDRSLILNALFRSSTTGLIKEEAVPASVLDLATRIASQGTKK